MSIKPKVCTNMRNEASTRMSRAPFCQRQGRRVCSPEDLISRRIRSRRPKKARRLITANRAYQAGSRGTFIHPKFAQKLAKVSRLKRRYEGIVERPVSSAENAL
jgi:hypothetical protein